MPESPKVPNITIAIRETGDGHLVEWVKNGVSGSVGPYVDEEMAQRVLDAKLRELTENTEQNSSLGEY